MNLKHLIAITGLAASTLLPLTGCQSQGEVDRYRTQYRTAQDQILDLQARLSDKERQIDILRGAKNPNQDMRNQLVDADTQRIELEAEITRLQGLLERAGTTPIPIELADELEKLAAANPELMSYDKETGAIQFRSDVTFALGKAEVRQSALPIISKLAGVLSAPVAADYEVRVAGHTDNVPMKNAMNRQRYGDNWGLSTARAVSVMKAFSGAGIPEVRMSVAGYGEYRPVEPNGEKGSSSNRRVEIYLVPLAEKFGGSSRNTPKATTPETTPATPDIVAPQTPATPEASLENTAEGGLTELKDVMPVADEDKPELYK